MPERLSAVRGMRKMDCLPSLATCVMMESYYVVQTGARVSVTKQGVSQREASPGN